MQQFVYPPYMVLSRTYDVPRLMRQSRHTYGSFCSSRNCSTFNSASAGDRLQDYFVQLLEVPNYNAIIAQASSSTMHLQQEHLTQILALLIKELYQRRRHIPDPNPKNPVFLFVTQISLIYTIYNS